MKAIMTVMLIMLLAGCSAFEPLEDGFQISDIPEIGSNLYRTGKKVKSVYCASSLSELRGRMAERVRENEDVTGKLEQYDIEYTEEGFCAITGCLRRPDCESRYY